MKFDWQCGCISSMQCRHVEALLACLAIYYTCMYKHTCQSGVSVCQPQRRAPSWNNYWLTGRLLLVRIMQNQTTNYHFSFIDNNTLLKKSYCTTTYRNINNGLLKSDSLSQGEIVKFVISSACPHVCPQIHVMSMIVCFLFFPLLP